MTQSLLTQAGTPQVLHWTTPQAGIFLPLNEPIELKAEASSGLPLQFEVILGSANLNGHFLTVTQLGTIRVKVKQVGNAEFDPVEEIREWNRSSMTAFKLGSFKTRGLVTDMEIRDGIAFLAANESGFLVMDVTDPSNPFIKGRILERHLGEVKKFQFMENLAYLLTDRGLYFVDVSEPEASLIIGSIPSRFSDGVIVLDDYAYLSALRSTTIYDISDLDNPSFFRTFGTPFMVAAGGLIFTNQADEGIWLLDISLRTHPRRLTHIATGTYPAFLYDEPLVYLLNNESEFSVVDLQNPLKPNLLHSHVLDFGIDGSSFNPPNSNSPIGMNIHEGLAFITLRRADVQVVDISDPSQAYKIGDVPGSGTPHVVRVSGSTVYTGGLAGLEIFSLDARMAQVIEWHIPETVRGASTEIELNARSSSRLPVSYEVLSGPGRIEGSTLITEDLGEIRVVAQHLGNEQFLPTSESRLIKVIDAKRQSILFDEPPVHQVLLVGHSYPLAAQTNSGLPVSFELINGPGTIEGSMLTVTDIGEIRVRALQSGNENNDPVSVERVFNRNLITGRQAGRYEARILGPGGIKVRGDHAFLGAGEKGLVILDIRLPESPVELAVVSDVDPTGVEIQGNHVYVRHQNGFDIVDITDIQNPRRLSRYQTNARIECMRVAGSLVYLNEQSRYLSVVDVTTPDAPVLLTRFDMEKDLRCFEIEGDRAYVGQGLQVNVLDIRDPLKLESIGRHEVPGLVYGLEIVDDLTFAGLSYQSFEVVDFRDPEQTRTLSIYEGITNGTGDIHYVDGLLYQVANTGGLSVYDVDNPQDPQRLGGYQIGPGHYTSLEIQGKYAYMASRDAGFEIVELVSRPRRFIQTLQWDVPGDIDFPEKPIDLPAHSDLGMPIEYQILEGNAQLNGNQLNIQGYGAVHILATHPGTRQVFPIRNVFKLQVQGGRPQTVQWLAPHPEANIPLNQPVKLTALASSGLPVMYRVESGRAKIEDNHLTILNHEPVMMVAHQAGNNAFAPATLRIRLNGTQAPVDPIGTIPTGGYTDDVSILPPHAYLADRIRGLDIIDIDDPGSPLLIGTLFDGTLPDEQPEAKKVMASFDVVMTDGVPVLTTRRGRMQPIDVSNPAQPRPLLNTPPWVDVPSRTTSTGSMILTAEYWDGIQIFDLSKVTHPIRMSGFDTRGAYAQSSAGAFDVAVEGTTAFVAAPRGMWMLDISNPYDPVSIGTYDGPPTYQVALRGSIAVLAGREHGLILVDISDVSHPVMLAHLDMFAKDVAIYGHVAYVPGQHGIDILDIGNPSQPVRIGSLNTDGHQERMEIYGGYGYVASGAQGLKIFDLADTRLIQTMSDATQEPTEEGKYQLPAFSHQGLPLEYSIVSGPGKLNGHALEFTDIGSVTLKVEQSGDNHTLPLQQEWTFTHGSHAPPVSTARIGDDTLQVTVPTTSGNHYELQSKNSLDDPHWEPIEGKVGTGTIQSWNINIQETNIRFFRIWIRSIEE